MLVIREFRSGLLYKGESYMKNETMLTENITEAKQYNDYELASKIARQLKQYYNKEFIVEEIIEL